MHEILRGKDTLPALVIYFSCAAVPRMPPAPRMQPAQLLLLAAKAVGPVHISTYMNNRRKTL